MDKRRNISQNGSTTSISRSKDTTNTIFLLVLGAMIIIIGGLIIISFIIKRRLRQRPANIMIFSQACTDLFTALVFIPLHMVQNETTEIISQFLGSYMLYLSLFNLLVISIDRYLALNKPFLHRKLINVRNTIKMLVGAWLAPFVALLIPLSWWFCEDHVRRKATQIYIGAIWSIMLVLVILMTVLYVLATKGAKETIRSRRISVSSVASSRAAALAQKELRVVHLFGLLLSFFLMAYLPILYINFCFLIGLQEYVPHDVVVVSLYLLICNSVLNPLICIILKKDYLDVIRKMIPCIEDDDVCSSSTELSTAFSESEPDLKKKISFGFLNSPKPESREVLHESLYHDQHCRLGRNSSSTFLNLSNGGSSSSGLFRLPVNSPGYLYDNHRVQASRARKSGSALSHIELMEMKNLMMTTEL